MNIIIANKKVNKEKLAARLEEASSILKQVYRYFQLLRTSDSDRT